MPRPRKGRRLQWRGGGFVFGPRQEGCSEETLLLGRDQWEALRLSDYQGLNQEEGAREMMISRATYGRILQSARRLVARALTEGLSVGLECPAAECLSSPGRGGQGRGRGYGGGRGRGRGPGGVGRGGGP